MAADQRVERLAQMEPVRQRRQQIVSGRVAHLGQPDLQVAEPGHVHLPRNEQHEQQGGFQQGEARRGAQQAAVRRSRQTSLGNGDRKPPRRPFHRSEQDRPLFAVPRMPDGAGGLAFPLPDQARDGGILR